jgi:hypothetical protein
LTGKLTVFQYPTFRGIQFPSPLHEIPLPSISYPKVFKIRLKVILPPTPSFLMSHPEKSPFPVPSLDGVNRYLQCRVSKCAQTY